MPSRSPVRPVLAAAVLGLAATLSGVADAGSPPVPPVAEIPVAPIPAAKRKVAPAETRPPTTVVTTTTTTTVPALTAVPVEPTTRTGATEVMPPQPPAPAPLHVVLVDELPFKAMHSRARELPEHPEHPHHSKHKGRHGRPFHPAPGIVVDVSEASGGATAEDLQRDARSAGYWPFRHCYEEGLRRDQHLGGKVTMDLAVAPGGAVQSANITGATLHDESVVLCVAREAEHLTLAAGEATTAKMGVNLSTGDEPVPTPHAAPHADDLREALRASWPQVKQCYASSLAKHPDSGGRMELRFHAKGSEITEVTENETRFGDVDVTRCVLGVYRTAKLPSVGHGSHEASFVYALHFEARPEAPAPTAAK